MQYTALYCSVLCCRAPKFLFLSVAHCSIKTEKELAAHRISWMIDQCALFSTDQPATLATSIGSLLLQIIFASSCPLSKTNREICKNKSNSVMIRTDAFWIVLVHVLAPFLKILYLSLSKVQKSG